MVRINNKLYKIFIGILWLLLFGNVFAAYKDIKELDIPVTTLNFDIALIDVKSDQERGSFYYDTGKGFNKDEVAVFPYLQTQGSEFKNYSVKLFTKKKIKRLRFDPLDNEGTVTIKNLIVQQYTKNNVTFSLSEIEDPEKHGIGDLSDKGDSVTVTAIGKDPHFVLIEEFHSYQN